MSRRRVDGACHCGGLYRAGAAVRQAAARSAGAPYVVLEKTRRGDREVDISIPDLARWVHRTPVLVDDIVSTGRTMIETLRRLKTAAAPAPVCVAIHGVFVGSAYADLLAAGARQIVSTNTIPHESNGIDVAAMLAQAIRQMANSRL